MFKNIVVYIFLVSLYITYSQYTDDFRVNRDFLFYILISYVVLGINYSYIRLLNINSRSIFFDSLIFFWSFAFYVNSFKIFGLQIKWTSIELAYLIYFMPIIAFSITLIFKNNKNNESLKTVNNKYLFIINIFLFILAYSIMIYEMIITGVVPIFMSNINEARLEYALSFIHVVGETFLNLSFYVAAYFILIAKYKLKWNYLIILFCLMYYLITFSRSGIMQIGIFSIIFFALSHNRNFLLISIKKIILILLLIVSFSILGDIRQEKGFSIQDYTESKINNDAINWLYGYYFVNIDNLLLSIETDPVDLSFKRSFLFLSQILRNKLSDEDYNNYTYIGKLNLGTGFRDFTLDWGIFLGTIFLALLVGFYTMLLNLLKTNLFILYKAILITYIALFPMVNRFSDFIPFFIFISIYLIDKFFNNKNKIKISD